MRNKEIIPASWRDSFKELREDLSQTLDRWLSRLRPEERREAEAHLKREGFPELLGNTVFWDQPRIDMEEDTENLYVSVEVPGLKKDELSVDLDGRRLSVFGEKESRNEKKRGRTHYAECTYGAFSRSIALPCDVDRDGVKAKCRNGLLKITLPKTEKAKARQIEVNYED